MDQIDTTFLSNPEEFLALSSPDQLLVEYPNQFIENDIDLNPKVTENLPYSKLNKSNYQNNKVIVELSRNNRENGEKERVFCSMNGISIIESDDTYNIWDLDMTDEKVLGSINSKVVALAVRNEIEKKKCTEEIIIPDYNRVVKVTYLPKTVESSNYLIALLNKRKELLQK